MSSIIERAEAKARIQADIDNLNASLAIWEPDRKEAMEKKRRYIAMKTEISSAQSKLRTAKAQLSRASFILNNYSGFSIKKFAGEVSEKMTSIDGVVSRLSGVSGEASRQIKKLEVKIEQLDNWIKNAKVSIAQLQQQFYML